MLSTPRDLGASPAWPRHHCPPSPHTPRLAHLPATGCGSPPPSCPTCGRQHRSGGPSESKCKGEAMPGVLPQCQSELGAGGVEPRPTATAMAETLGAFFVAPRPRRQRCPPQLQPQLQLQLQLWWTQSPLCSFVSAPTPCPQITPVPQRGCSWVVQGRV
ncbi:MAG: hypothetical protein WDW36_005183 [Sanguina aurantia]